MLKSLESHSTVSRRLYRIVTEAGGVAENKYGLPTAMASVALVDLGELYVAACDLLGKSVMRCKPSDVAVVAAAEPAVPDPTDPEIADKHVKGVNVQQLRNALRNFTNTIEATGGVRRRDTRSCVYPAADKAWTDLGEAYMAACKATGKMPMLNAQDDEET
jgi:hypothetical protein